MLYTGTQGQQYLPCEMGGGGAQVTNVRMLSWKLLVASAPQARVSVIKLGVLGFILAWLPDGRSKARTLC